MPTNSLELAEITAARNLAMRGEIEPRAPLRQPVDVLVQHVLTTAAGSGVQEREFLAEVRSTGAYHELSDAVWNWTLAFAAAGGKSLAAYETFRRLEREGETWRFRDRRLLLRHRLSIGTITADASVPVRFPTGGVLGSVEESFVARLRPGDRFLFAGRLLELVRFRDRQAIVRGAGSSRKAVGTPRWMGGKMPLSTCLGAEVRRVLDAAAEGIFPSPEMERLKPILEIQKVHSVVPKADEILIELLESREGHHAFIFPFEGRLVHEGLAALFAYRLARKQPRTFTFAINDYGFELLSNAPFPIEEFFADLLSQEHLEEDILGSINSGEMMRRRFREIARIAGLTFEGFPGRAARGRGRPMQVNSSLLYDVFRRYEPDHLLLEQARREVLEGQLEARRLREALRRMGGARAVFCHPPRPTPLAFPLMVERLREVLSTEALSDRLLRMQREMEEELAASPERRITAKAK